MRKMRSGNYCGLFVMNKRQKIIGGCQMRFVVFLDIDGVLNTRTTVKRTPYHTKEYCLVIETTADRKEYDFHRVLEYYPECSFDSFTIKEYSIIFEHGPEISYLDFHKYIQYKFIQLMG